MLELRETSFSTSKFSKNNNVKWSDQNFPTPLSSSWFQRSQMHYDMLEMGSNLIILHSALEVETVGLQHSITATYFHIRPFDLLN